LKLPSLELVVAFNASIRHNDEWFEEADDLDRIQRILSDLQNATDPLVVAAIATSRIARAQAFTEGNKRTALLVGRWILDRNDFDGSLIIPPDDYELANLLLDAARGGDTAEKVIELFESRRALVGPVGIEPTTEGL
jgi:prophage maintenance system killer protein